MFLVVDQFYQSRVNDEFVLRGNSATIKCILPSFVADFVHVLDWETDKGETFTLNDNLYGNSHEDILTKLNPWPNISS